MWQCVSVIRSYISVIFLTALNNISSLYVRISPSFQKKIIEMANNYRVPMTGTLKRDPSPRMSASPHSRLRGQSVCIVNRYRLCVQSVCIGSVYSLCVKCVQ